MRKTLQMLSLVAVLSFATAACGDKTVTSSPATPGTVAPDLSPTVTGADDATGAADDAQLADVERMLRDIEADLSAVDQDASTPEGDPTQ